MKKKKELDYEKLKSDREYKERVKTNKELPKYFIEVAFVKKYRDTRDLQKFAATRFQNEGNELIMWYKFKTTTIYKDDILFYNIEKVFFSDEKPYYYDDEVGFYQDK